MVQLLCLLGTIVFGAVCVGIAVWFEALKKKRAPAVEAPKTLVHSINDDRCTGCDACIDICPTQVLELVENKSRVVDFDACTQCEQCAIVCPTSALVMHFEGTEPAPFRMPELDDFYQAADGLYLIGEAAGKPLVKNASNLGRAAVEHIAQRRATDPHCDDAVDVLIVGSGPAGLSAALSCIEHGLSYLVLEKDDLMASTIARYPVGKMVMAEPYDVECVGRLPVWDAGKDEILAAWRQLLDKNGVQVSLREAVETVKRVADGSFTVKTTRRTVRTRKVILGIGTRGKPRRLGVPGENQANVSPLLTDPAKHRGQNVLVVGGGDSAVEAAVALAATARSVILSYRGSTLSRCKSKNRQALAAQVEAGRIKLMYGSSVVAINRDAVDMTVGGEAQRHAIDHTFVCIGGEGALKWLESLGVRFVDQPHMFQRLPTDKTVAALTGESLAPSDTKRVRLPVVKNARKRTQAA